MFSDSTAGVEQISELVRPSVKDTPSAHEYCLVLEDTAERFPSMFLSFPNPTVRYAAPLVELNGLAFHRQHIIHINLPSPPLLELY